MDINQLIVSEKPILSLDQLTKDSELNFSFIDQLKSEAQSFQDTYSENMETIKRFVEGQQWEPMSVKYHGKSSYNVAGKPVWDFTNSFNSDQDSNSTVPKRTINLTKSYLESMVAQFAEVDPFPVAKIRRTISTPEREELREKINLLFEYGFKKENNLDELYEVACMDALQSPYAVWQVLVDEERSKTEIPIKIRVIDPMRIKFDPEAQDLDEATYFFHTEKMRYYDLKTLYDYEYDKDKQAKKGAKGLKSEPSYTELVEVDYLWFRTRVAVSGLAKPVWLLFATYDQTWIKPKGADGKPAAFEEILQTMIWDRIPYVIQRAKAQRGIPGESLVPDMMSSQIEYNKMASIADWNFLMTGMKPVITNMKQQDVIDGMIPGGIIPLQGNGIIKPAEITQIPQGEVEMRSARIKQDLQDILGFNVAMTQGERQKGVYSGAMLKQLEKLNNIKPQMYETKFLQAVSRLAERYLYVFSKFFGGIGVRLYSPRLDKDLEISSADVDSFDYFIEIETKDANLMSEESKFSIIRDFVQYAQASPVLLYLMAKMTDNAIPGIFSPEIMTEFENLYNAYKAQMSQQAAQMASQGQNAVVQQQETPQGEAPGNTGAEPAQEEESLFGEIDQDQFLQAVAEHKARLDEAGFGRQKAPDGQTMSESIIRQVLADAVDNGMGPGEILMYMESTVNNIINRNEMQNAEEIR